MFGIGIGELLLIAIVALVLVGPKKLPDLMRQGGKFFVQIRRTANEVKSTFDDVIREAENELRQQELEQLKAALQTQDHELKAIDVASKEPQNQLTPHGAVDMTHHHEDTTEHHHDEEFHKEVTHSKEGEQHPPVTENQSQNNTQSQSSQESQLKHSHDVSHAKEDTTNVQNIKDIN